MAVYSINKTDFFDLIKKDYNVWSKEKFTVYHFLKLYFTIPGFRFSCWLRYSLYVNDKNGIYKAMIHKHFRSISRKFSIDIPYIVELGGGVKIDHTLGIVINGFSKIGDGFIIKQNSSIVHNGKGKPTIGNNVWVGPNCVIVGGVTIGNNAVIGAGSIVVKDVPPDSIVVGNPGRVIRYQNKDEIVSMHY